MYNLGFLHKLSYKTIKQLSLNLQNINKKVQVLEDPAKIWNYRKNNNVMIAGLCTSQEQLSYIRGLALQQPSFKFLCFKQKTQIFKFSNITVYFRNKAIQMPFKQRRQTMKQGIKWLQKQLDSRLLKLQNQQTRQELKRSNQKLVSFISFTDVDQQKLSYYQLLSFQLNVKVGYVVIKNNQTKQDILQLFQIGQLDQLYQYMIYRYFKTNLTILKADPNISLAKSFLHQCQANKDRKHIKSQPRLFSMRFGNIHRRVALNIEQFIQQNSNCIIMYQDTDIHSELMLRYFKAGGQISQNRDTTYGIINCLNNDCPPHQLDVLVRFKDGVVIDTYNGDFSIQSIRNFLTAKI